MHQIPEFYFTIEKQRIFRLTMVKQHDYLLFSESNYNAKKTFSASQWM